MKKRIILILTTLTLITATSIEAQTLLSPGDLSIICVNADGAKSFAVLFFRDVEAGTVIHFTDNAWMGGEQCFRETEGVLTFTAAEEIGAGAVVVCPSNDGGDGFVESGAFNPAGSGDNIIVYQGTTEDPFFIYGIGWARGETVWEYSIVSASYRSDVPMGLSFEDGTVVSLGTSDGYCYSGTLGLGDSVTHGELFSVLSDASNFDISNSDEFSWSGGDFSVSSVPTWSSLWLNTATNWSNIAWTNDTPTRFSEVEINGYFQLGHSVTVHSLTIQAGAKLEILPGGSLTVRGELKNFTGADGLLIKADESGSGAIYSSTDGVEGIVEVFLTPDQWHFVSFPVTGTQTIGDVFGVVGDHLLGVYNYDEASGEWVAQGSGDSGIQGFGYNVKYETNSKTLTFVGTLNNFRNRRFFTVSRGAGGGWNLIGNPFPAPMCWSQYMIQENLEHETIYVTTGGSGGDTQWDTFNGMSGIGVPENDVGNVAVGQAFWVRAAEGGGSIGVGCYAKTAGESRFKIGAVAKQHNNLHPVPGQARDDNGGLGHRSRKVIRLQLCDMDGAVDQVAVCFDHQADEGFDGLDSEKMGWEGIRMTNDERRMTRSSIAAPVEDIYCVIASFPSPELTSEQSERELTPTIPITLNLGSTFLHSLQLLGSEHDFTSIILEDRLLGIMHDLSDQSVYEFHAGGGFLFDRFFLRVSFGGWGGDELVGVESLRVDNAKKLKGKAYYDIRGRKIADLQSAVPGVYLEVLEFEGFVERRKIFYNGTLLK